VPGLTTDAGHTPAPACGPDEHCITCGDVAVPMRVVRLDAAEGLAWCREADEPDPGVAETVVDAALVGGLEPGDVVLVHAGAALVRLDTPGDAA
jgi:hydrogenase expression/formation protein HypC